MSVQKKSKQSKTSNNAKNVPLPKKKECIEVRALIIHTLLGSSTAFKSTR